MRSIKISLLLISSLIITDISAQVLTREDSLSNGLIRKESTTVISGYGEAKCEYDLRYNIGNANLTRVVLFIGHKFTDKISFFSEMELEDGQIAGGSPGGEIAMEQAFLKFNLNKNIYLAAGLFIPRIGIINENHLPTTFNGNDRPIVETLLIPSTWRELGVGLYGTSQKIAGLNYSFGLVNGLSSANFRSGNGIREGRFEGQNATASNIAVTGALLYYKNNFRIQTSGYYGGSAGLSKREADSLQLSYGAFGTPVAVGEINIQYNNNGFSFKGLASIIDIANAAEINRAYNNNTAKTMRGEYLEIGYNLFELFNKTDNNLTLFVRYENLDLNYAIPKNGITNGILKQQYIVTGITYKPIRGVAVKADYVYKQTGDPNPALIINPFPQAPVYYNTNGFVNLGVAYSF